MAPPRPDWHSVLPAPASKLTLEELRNAKKFHAFITERVPGPPAIARFIRGYHALLLFGTACVFEDRYPALTRCWQELHSLFAHDPTADDGMFIQCWMLMDFPFGPDGQTALTYFEEFLGETELLSEFAPFIKEAETSRLGLYQDVMRTKKVGKFRELFTGNVASVLPTVEYYEQGEIMLVRLMRAEEHTFIFGHPKSFPKHAKKQLEAMVEDKLFYFVEAGDSVPKMYEAFMRLAGPYWMSCVAKNQALPILDPLHYQTYLDHSLAMV